jgi:hypothetical protein
MARDSLQQRVEAVTQVAAATKDLSPEAQAKAQEAILGPPSQAATNALWLIFVPAMLFLAGLFGFWLYDLIRDGKTETDPALVGQALTFILGAIAGLFIKSPVQGSGT